ncbi:MAG: hypothetical protein LBQ54_12440 [Planctomycetaceae bacterium]|nr:hypothetical protein [Planctomycetaceae bacterium]
MPSTQHVKSIASRDANASALDPGREAPAGSCLRLPVEILSIGSRPRSREASAVQRATLDAAARHYDFHDPKVRNPWFNNKGGFPYW